MQELFAECITSIIFEDNAGAIFLVKNQKAGSRTKHIDVRYHYGRELYGEKKVLPAYVNTLFNYADGLTKNQPEKLFSDHRVILMNGGLIYRKEDERLH